MLEKDVHKLKETLLSISEEQVARMQAVMRREEVWKVFSYQRPSQHGDAFSALLTELYHRSKHARPASHRAWPPKGK